MKHKKPLISDGYAYKRVLTRLIRKDNFKFYLCKSYSYSNKRGISNEENLLKDIKEYISYEERQLFITLSQLAWNKAKYQNIQGN